MAFSLPDLSEAAFPHQAKFYQTDIDILVAGMAGTGVISGCAVTAQGSPNMTVAVAAGTVSVAGTQVAVTSGNVTITAADATNPRFDIVVVNSSGTKSATAGTPAASPLVPDIPANSVVLATVYVPATDTAINTNQIADRRVTLGSTSPLLVPNGSASNPSIALAADIDSGFYSSGVGNFRLAVAGSDKLRTDDDGTHGYASLFARGANGYVAFTHGGIEKVKVFAGEVQILGVPLLMQEQSAPGTPPSGFSYAYPKSDGRWYIKDDAGVESALSLGPQRITATKTSAYTAVDGDLVPCTGTWTLQLPVATVNSWVTIKNKGSGVITVDGNGAELIDGSATVTVLAGDSLDVVADGTGWLRV